MAIKKKTKKLAKKTKSVAKKPAPTKKKLVKKTKAATPKAKPRVKVKKKTKAKKVVSSSVVPKSDITSKTLKVISEIDTLEVQLADIEDEMRTKIASLPAMLGTEKEPAHSFEHPERGPMSILTRNGRTFWRGKPVGKQAA